MGEIVTVVVVHQRKFPFAEMNDLFDLSERYFILDCADLTNKLKRRKECEKNKNELSLTFNMRRMIVHIAVQGWSNAFSSHCLIA